MTWRCCFVAARANAKFGMNLRKRRHRATLSLREATKKLSRRAVAQAGLPGPAGVSGLRMSVDFFLITGEQKASSMPGSFVTAESTMGLAARGVPGLRQPNSSERESEGVAIERHQSRRRANAAARSAPGSMPSPRVTEHRRKRTQKSGKASRPSRAGAMVFSGV